MIIVRPELERDLKAGKWTLVYGRRKTGKTFLVTNFCDFDHFYFVKRDRTIISKDDWRTIDQQTMMELLRRDLSDGRTVVIDEFHRLGPDLLDLLHSMEMKGRLVLISSTLHLFHQLISSSSPLLGKVSEVKVPLISYLDLLSSVPGKGRRYYELLAFRTEPLVIALEYPDPVEAVRGSVLTVPALIGEIFSEEDRKLSSTYEGIMRAISVGKRTSGEISSYLYSRKLIAKDDPSLIQQYISNLMELGIVGRMQVWKKNRFVYEHSSPLMWAFFYLDERYNISERELTRKELRRALDELMPHIMEHLIRISIAARTGSSVMVDHSAEGEIDGIMVRFKRPMAAIEVKWKKRIGKDEVSRIREKLMSNEAEKRYLVVPDRNMVEIDGIEVLEPSDILNLS